MTKRNYISKPIDTQKLGSLYVSVAGERAKLEFIGNMSHELKSPLNSIIGFSEMLQQELYGPLNEKQKEYVNFILSSGRELMGLINEVIDFARLPSSKKGIQSRSSDKIQNMR